MIEFSIIIPVYNSEIYLEECLNSVLAQEYSNYEIICVNDGSTDQSLKILKNYEQKHDCITVLNQKNRGQSVARNNALEIARGKYVYFLDSDDRIVTTMLSEIHQIMENDELDVLYFAGQSFFEKEDLEEKHEEFKTRYSRTQVYKGIKPGQEMLKELVENGEYSVSPCLQVIKKEFLDRCNIRFYPGIIHEDNLFSFQVILQALRCKTIDKAYFYRRVRINSVMTNEENYKNLRGYFTCLIEEMRFLQDHSFNAENLKAIQQTVWLANYHTQRIYLNIPVEEREYFLNQCTQAQRIFFESMILSTIVMKVKHNHRVEDLKNEIRDLKHSVSFRIGRGITFPLRKVRGGIKCCTDHGLLYTFRLIGKKICQKH